MFIHSTDDCINNGPLHFVGDLEISRDLVAENIHINLEIVPDHDIGALAEYLLFE